MARRFSFERVTGGCSVGSWSMMMRRLSLCLFAVVSLAFAGPAFSVHDENFELEGNILGGDPPNPPTVDWEDLFNPGGNPNPPPSPAGSLPSGFGEPTFVRDFVPGGKSDTTSFATGSKDTLNPTPGWQCKKINNFGGKFDMINAYAVPYTAPNGDIIVYFAMERDKNEGSANVGFWFFQDGTVGCEETGGGATAFTGNHVDGDLFIVSEFTGGGSVSTIKVYRWSGGAAGSLNPTAVVSGADCKANPIADDKVCATVNTVVLDGFGANTDIPWLTETSQPGNTASNDLDVSLFFEGALNLTASGLNACFTRFMGVTRSSFTLGSDMKDYALGNFNLCSIDVSKTSTCTGFTSDSAGNLTFQNQALVTVLNDGGAPLPAGTITCCDNAGTGIPTGQEGESQTGDDVCFTIPTALATTPPNDTVTTPVDFTSTGNGPPNKVFCTADLGGGATTSDGGEANTVQCSASPDLYVDKACETKLVFDDPVGRVVVKVLVNGQVCNTSASKADATTKIPIFNVQVNDNKAVPSKLLGPVVLDAGVPCDVDGDCPVGTPCVGADSISGDDGVCFKDATTEGVFFDGPVCLPYTGGYTPATPNTTSMDPTVAEFSDEVTASGSVDTDVSSTVLPEKAMATCKLCPPEEVCEE
jgi:hypothetical protein